MILDRIKAFSQEEANDDDLYGYVPTKGVTLMFVILFDISTHDDAHLPRLVPPHVLDNPDRPLSWVLGHLGMEITATIIGPTPLGAAKFITLGAIIRILGPAYSRLRPRAYYINQSDIGAYRKGSDLTSILL
ncbi:uncharacterized protein BT62DRAFT_996662 [Guyanagaster necrorhizus]|uniref:Uncharacterized protein n=1 Tax=Guyanagaster necrorhizus TaxID=856835 RepID=A0A9P7VKE9_9AGAR|nr:uncharacterized protein BT62DRAFT_996662 [Guyanagaster necrorhizus MCA 3950]KAG7442262.1 hypothetical protein BT62DRAFT_996662 [Guyanagaster necrorhizus MCA 3950]